MKTLSIVVATVITFALTFLVLTSINQYVINTNIKNNAEVQDVMNKSECHNQTNGLGVTTYCKDSNDKWFRINEVGYKGSSTLSIIYLKDSDII